MATARVHDHRARPADLPSALSRDAEPRIVGRVDATLLLDLCHAANLPPPAGELLRS
jgi:hypothetical protein